MGALKPYSANRPAGVHWLGEVPAHWAEKRGKYFFCEVDERSVTGEEELLSVSHTTGVTPRSQKNVTMFKAESYAGHKVAQPNDIVVNTMWAWMSALGVSKHVGLVSPSYGVYRSLNRRDYLPAFVDNLLRVPQLKWEYICRSTGIRSSRLRLYPDEFLDIAFPCPPLPEQEKIIAFLRVKEVQIRRLVRNKRRLIALLNEKKQAVVNRVVTRGLDPNAPMKQTSIDWMPEVPAHWEVRKIKQVVSVFLSNVDKHSFEHEASVKLCNYVDVYKNDFINSGIAFMKATASEEEAARFSLQIGDVMITKDSETWNDIGVPAIVSEELNGVLCGYHLSLLRPEQDKVIPLFLFRVLAADSIARQFHVSANGVTRFGLSHVAIKNALIPVPPPPEQTAIGDYLQKTTADIDAAINRARRQIDLNREYRERLIADVVTGKLNVRDAKIDAPSDDEEGIHERARAGLGDEPEPVEADA